MPERLTFGQKIQALRTAWRTRFDWGEDMSDFRWHVAAILRNGCDRCLCEFGTTSSGAGTEDANA